MSSAKHITLAAVAPVLCIDMQTCLQGFADMYTVCRHVHGSALHYVFEHNMIHNSGPAAHTQERQKLNPKRPDSINEAGQTLQKNLQTNH